MLIISNDTTDQTSSTDPQTNTNPRTRLSIDPYKCPRNGAKLSTILVVALALVTVVGLGVGVAVSSMRAATASRDASNLEQFEKQAMLASQPQAATAVAGDPTLKSAIDATLAEHDGYKIAIRSMEARLDALYIRVAGQQAGISEAAGLSSILSLQREISALNQSIAIVSNNLEIVQHIVAIHVANPAEHALNNSRPGDNLTNDDLQLFTATLDELAVSVAQHDQQLPQMQKVISDMQQSLSSAWSELGSSVCKCKSFPGAISVSGPINGASITMT